jgi:hypothetical protein
VRKKADKRLDCTFEVMAKTDINLHEQRDKAEILIVEIHSVVESASIRVRECVRSKQFRKNAERRLNRVFLTVLAPVSP